MMQAEKAEKYVSDDRTADQQAQPKKKSLLGLLLFC